MASIHLDSVTVEFPIYGVNTRSLKKQILMRTVGGKFNNQENKIISVRALDNISLDIQEGDRIGLIGHNGAGKSTLLRVLAKIYEPTNGIIRINGKISTLLDLTLGMDPESTGYDNIVMSGVIQGHSKKDILKRKEQIAEFSELKDYLNMPVRTYSAGMMLRLAFSIATSISNEILLLDEVVGVGDTEFIEKAKRRINDIINNSAIVVLTSHDLTIVKEFCNKVLYLEGGKIKYLGPAKRTIELYNNDKLATV